MKKATQGSVYQASTLSFFLVYFTLSYKTELQTNRFIGPQHIKSILC